MDIATKMILETLKGLILKLEAPPVIPGKKKRKTTVAHATLVLPTPVAPATQVTTVFAPGWKAELRGGLIVVTYASKAAYEATCPIPKQSTITPGDIFGYTGKAKEWRASEKWVRANKPAHLKVLGLE